MCECMHVCVCSRVSECICACVLPVSAFMRTLIHANHFIVVAVAPPEKRVVRPDLDSSTEEAPRGMYLWMCGAQRKKKCVCVCDIYI